MSLAFRPALHILDATAAFVDGGPSGGKVVHPRLVIASRDILAIDVTGLAVLRHHGTNRTSRTFRRGPSRRSATASRSDSACRRRRDRRAGRGGPGDRRPQAADGVTTRPLTRLRRPPWRTRAAARERARPAARADRAFRHDSPGDLPVARSSHRTCQSPGRAERLRARRPGSCAGRTPPRRRPRCRPRRARPCVSPGVRAGRRARQWPPPEPPADQREEGGLELGQGAGEAKPEVVQPAHDQPAPAADHGPDDAAPTRSGGTDRCKR